MTIYDVDCNINDLRKIASRQQREIKQKDEAIDIYKETIEKISAEVDRNHLGSVKDFENKIKTILADCESKLVSSQ